MAADPPVTRAERLALAAVLLLALALRTTGLNNQLWYDEIQTLVHFVSLPWGELVTDFSSLNNHMAYSLQAKAAVGVFGDEPWALRLPALLYGMASLPMLWWLGRGPAGRWPALAAVLLLAISYHHVWFTQNARGYTALLFWTMASTWALLRTLDRPGLRWPALHGLAIAAALYTHLSAAFFLLAQGLVWLLLVARDRRHWRPLIGYGIGGVLTLVLHLPILSQIGPAMGQVSRGSSDPAMAQWTDPARTLAEMANSLSGLGPLAPVLLAGALLLLAMGAVALARRAPVLAAVYLLSVPVSLAILLLLDFRIWPRYFFGHIGFVLLCVTVGADRLAHRLAAALRRPGWGMPLFAAGIAAMALASLVLLPRNYRLPKQDFAGAIAFVESARAPAERVVAIGLATEAVERVRPGWGGALARADPQAGGLWVITAFDDHVDDADRPVLAMVRARARTARDFDGTLGGGTVRVYHVPAPGVGKEERWGR